MGLRRTRLLTALKANRIGGIHLLPAISTAYPREKMSRKDWELKGFILEGDWTFVTINSVDFRGPRSNPGSSGEYAGVVLHAGLICFNVPDGIRRDAQLEMLDAAIQLIEEYSGEIINMLIKITLEDDCIEAQIFFLPSQELD